MTKIKFRLALLTTLFTISTIISQELGLGAGVAVGTESSIDDDLSGKMALGVNVRGLYKITPKWGITSGATYFFSTAPEPLETTLYVFNFDGLYSFVKNPVIDFYGLVGFDVVYAKFEDTEDSNAYDDSQLSMELGLGIMSRIGLFFEAKAEGAIEQGQFTLGYIINL
ncbi:outer membrane beta-barrel protein [Flagellimonas sp.]|uniref:outer membrane beta-barrel protein n=1 Tax=Flagellimonas sp. TaxID=2058762 RepID=UPI0034ABA90F